MTLKRLRDFVIEVDEAVTEERSEPTILVRLKAPLGRLLATDDWLPEQFSQSHPQYYQQYLLHCDPRQRFSIVSFVWGPGQKSPVHNHTVWGMIGSLRGGEVSTQYEKSETGSDLVAGEVTRMHPGDIELVSPDLGDIHQVSNAFEDRTSVSIHVYGANIGAVNRSVFDLKTGEKKNFVSGFSSRVIPNIWD